MAGLAAVVFVLAAVGLGAAVFVAAVPLAMGLVGVRVAEAVGFGFISPLVVAAAHFNFKYKHVRKMQIIFKR